MLCSLSLLHVCEWKYSYFYECRRLAVVFLAFDVFFAIFCVVLACLIGIALCCCLPCIIAILYAVAGQVRHKNLNNLTKEPFNCYLLMPILVQINRKVHQRQISVFFPSTDFKYLVTRKSPKLELVEWFRLRQAVDTWQMNAFFYPRMRWVITFDGNAKLLLF